MEQEMGCIYEWKREIFTTNAYLHDECNFEEAQEALYC